MQAIMEGYKVVDVDDVAHEVDIWVTATGNKDILALKTILKMKNMAILSNIGHFNVEIDVKLDILILNK